MTLLSISTIVDLDHSLNLEPELLNRIKATSVEYNFEQVVRYISDDLLRRLAFAVTPHEVAEQTIELFEAGTQSSLVPLTD